jgi:hypothetical protein
MYAWRAFLASLDTPGGHLLVLALGALLGVGLLAAGVADGHTVLVGSGGALLALLRTSASTAP